MVNSAATAEYSSSRPSHALIYPQPSKLQVFACPAAVGFPMVSMVISAGGRGHASLRELRDRQGRYVTRFNGSAGDLNTRRARILDHALAKAALPRGCSRRRCRPASARRCRGSPSRSIMRPPTGSIGWSTSSPPPFASCEAAKETGRALPQAQQPRQGCVRSRHGRRVIGRLARGDRAGTRCSLPAPPRGWA